MVVGRRATVRWALASALQLSADAACPPDLALSRLTHPASRPPDVVLLVVEDGNDLAWLRGHSARTAAVPVVAAVARPSLARAARTAGAREVVNLGTSALVYSRAVQAAAAPAVVIDLDAARTA